jgi:hypothetical protein
VIAGEDRLHECAVDRPPVPGDELGQLLAPLLERGRAFAGPDERVERSAPDEIPYAITRSTPRARRM